MNGCSVSVPKHRAHNKSAAIKIPLTAVPEAVLASVDAHVPGIYLNEAHLTHQGEKEIYELEGLSQSATYEISATSNGHILEVDHDASLSD